MSSEEVTLRQIYDKLIEHDNQFARIDNQFETIHQKLNNHDQQFRNVATHVLNLDKSIKARLPALINESTGSTSCWTTKPARLNC